MTAVWPTQTGLCNSGVGARWELVCEMIARFRRSESVWTGVWCVQGFGAGFEIALEPSKLPKEGENPGKGHFYFPLQLWYEPKPWFKRDLNSQERKISPKRKFLGRTSLRHLGGIRAGFPAQNFGQGGQNPGKNKHFGADIHDPKARTSTTPPKGFPETSVHININFLSGWSWDDPGFVPGISPGLSLGQIQWKPGDKPGFSPYFTQWKPDFHRVCPWDKPGLSLGQSRGRRAAQKVYVKKMFVTWPLFVYQRVPH